MAWEDLLVWSAAKPAEMEEERRVLYVGMTRARHTLAIFNRMDRRNPFIGDLTGPCFAPRREGAGGPSATLMGHDYEWLGLDDVFLDFAGRHDAGHPIHAALGALQPVDSLGIRMNGERPILVNPKGTLVAQLSSSAAERWRDGLAGVQRVEVVCMVVRLRTDCKEPDYQTRLRVGQWEVSSGELSV